MIRYLYIIGLVFGCTGLTVQAKGTTPTADAPSTTAKAKKADAKSTASTNDKDKAKSTTASAPERKQDTTKSTVAKASEKPTSSSRPSSAPVASAHSYTSSAAHSGNTSAGGRLARLTAYWAGEGDYYTGKCMSSTGIRLHDGHCAVDPRIIPYGSTVEIPGFGKYLAVDTGSAVISREAAKETARTPEERNALVIDLFFESRRDGERFAASATKYAQITWTAPRSTASTQDVRSMPAE